MTKENKGRIYIVKITKYDHHDYHPVPVHQYYYFRSKETAATFHEMNSKASVLYDAPLED